MTLDPKHAWQAIGDPHDAPALSEVRVRADKFYRKVRRRNVIEYVTCIFAVVLFSRNVFVLPHILQKIGSGMILAATFYVAWQLHSRGSAVTPDKAGGVPIHAFLRTQLVRQRDALRSVFWWYILPFLPGITLVLIGNGQVSELSRQVPIWMRWAALGLLFTIFTGVWWLNQLGARQFQRRIDEIDALTAED